MSLEIVLIILISERIFSPLCRLHSLDKGSKTVLTWKKVAEHKTGSYNYMLTKAASIPCSLHCLPKHVKSLVIRTGFMALWGSASSYLSVLGLKSHKIVGVMYVGFREKHLKVI